MFVDLKFPKLKVTLIYAKFIADYHLVYHFHVKLYLNFKLQKNPSRIIKTTCIGQFPKWNGTKWFLLTAPLHHQLPTALFDGAL